MNTVAPLLVHLSATNLFSTRRKHGYGFNRKNPLLSFNGTSTPARTRPKPAAVMEQRDIPATTCACQKLQSADERNGKNSVVVY